MPDPSNVLIIAPHVDGTDVGESLSNFRWVRGIAAHFDTTLLTYHRRDRTPAKGQLPNVDVIEWRDLPVAGRFPRLNSRLKPGYAAFYRRARRWIRRALAQGRRFDLVHQVSPLALRYPCPAVGLGQRLIIGPLGGSVPTPAGFEHAFGSESWYMKLRDLDGMRLRRDPWLRRGLLEAEVVIGVAPYVRERLAPLELKRFELMNETGIVELPAHVHRPAFRPDAVRLLYVGRLTRSKGVRDLVRAMSQLDDCPGVHLDVLGDGEDRAACEAMASELTLTDRITFHGRVPRERVDAFYSNADIFTFPSLREASGNVVLEAMSHALPLVCATTGGPGFVVTDDTGIRVEPTSPEAFASGLASAIRALATDPERARRMGEAARQCIERHHLWDRKIERLVALYRELIPTDHPSGDP